MCDFVTIDYNDCKHETLFEILVAVDYCQVLGRHRDPPHPDFRYNNVGCKSLGKLGIMYRNGLYNQLHEKFKDVLDLDPIKKRQKLQQKSRDPFHTHVNPNGSKDQVKSDSFGSLTLATHQIYGIALWTERFYVPGKHYFFMRPFLGTLVWSWANEESVTKIIDKICNDMGDLSTGNKQKWYGLLTDAYQRIQDGLNVEGKYTLIRALQRNFGLNEKEATEQVEVLISMIRWTGSETGSGKKQEEKSGQQQSQQEPNSQEDTEFLSKVPNRNPIGYATYIIQKTVKQDTSLVKLITYKSLSAYTNDPINLAIIAPTAEGKTHPVEQTISKFPDNDVQRIGTMSSKVLIRQDGILVNENNESIEQDIADLENRIENCKETGEDPKALKARLEVLLKDARCLIDFRNKIYVFFEPPERRMWDILKPILSHDTEYMTHNYVYDIPGTGFCVKKIVTRGWPALIFCSAGGKNESSWPEWPEIASRCIVASPNMIPEKYHESNFLISQKKGLPKLIQQKIALAKECIAYIKSQIIDRTLTTWAPYSQILGDILPSEKGTDVRAFERLSSLYKTGPWPPWKVKGIILQLEIYVMDRCLPASRAANISYVDGVEVVHQS